MADVRARSVYYYIVNLEHPTRKRSLEETTIVRKEVFPDGKGTFKYVWGDITKNVSVHVYMFEESIPTSSAENSSMYLYKVDVDTNFI